MRSICPPTSGRRADPHRVDWHGQLVAVENVPSQGFTAQKLDILLAHVVFLISIRDCRMSSSLKRKESVTHVPKESPKVTFLACTEQ